MRPAATDRPSRQDSARRLFAGLIRREEGATAVEFALVAPAFLALLVAILQTGMVFFFQQVLQTATTQAARLIMTGQAQSQGLSVSGFQQDVCNDAGAMFDCSKLAVNVQTFSNFAGMQMTAPIANGTFNSGQTGYTPGGPGDIVLVQVYYQMPVAMAPLGFDLSNMSNSTRLLTATAVFRNEPYQ